MPDIEPPRRPRSSLPRLVMHGYFGLACGIGVHTVNLANALARRRPLLRYSNLLPLSRQATAIQAIRRRAAAGGSFLQMATNPPDYWPLLRKLPGPAIGFVAWESTRLPASWEPGLAAVDRIWVPSHWGREVMIAAGIAPERIDVVPEGVDTTVFRPDGPRLEWLAADPRPKFLTVGKFETRKCSRELINAFCEEFQAGEAVLVVSANNRASLRADPGLLARAVAGREDRVMVVDWLDSPADLAALYRSCDAFVLPTRGEGWGLPITEAMASGLPVIITGYSAPLDYAHAGNALLLPYHLVVAASQTYAFGHWAQPDFAALRARMRWLLTHRDQGRALGAAAAREMAGRWTWDHAAARADALMTGLGLTGTPPAAPARS